MKDNTTGYCLCCAGFSVLLYYRIGRIEETERRQGHFGGTFWLLIYILFVCVSDLGLQFQTFQQIAVFFVFSYIYSRILPFSTSLIKLCKRCVQW